MVLAAVVLWAVLMITSAVLATYALDVGGSPRHDAWIAMPIGIVAIPFPFVLASWFVVRLWRGRPILPSRG